MALLVLGSLLGLAAAAAQPAYHGTCPATVAIRDVHVIKGDGTPALGPTTLFIRDRRISAEPVAAPELELDGRGCYAVPGLVNTHGHIQEAAAGIAVPAELILKMWLACGVTTVRDNGGNFSRSVRLRARSRGGEIAAPRIFIYRGFGSVSTPDAARLRVRSFARGGADGIKLWSNFSYDRDLLEAILDEAKLAGLRTTAHIGVGASNARTYADLGVGCIEHWYGIPDAALDGVQRLPADFSYSNELHRFRWAGRLWREADPERLRAVLAELVAKGVAWSPTLAIYEASRDLQRAQRKPWFDEFLHPAFERFFAPSLDSHGSYFLGWTSTDEACWKENYRIWMQAVREFERLGGIVTTGDDAGYIYCLHGFALIRELELHQEAGFQPLEVIRHATFNGARVLGQAELFGLIRPGLAADVAIVDGNPLADLKVFYPTGASRYADGRAERTEGVRWTIKDGYVYHVPTLVGEIKAIVADARARVGAGDGR